MSSIICMICEQQSHSPAKCPCLHGDLKEGFFTGGGNGGGGHSHDEDERMLTTSGNVAAQPCSQMSGSSAGHWNPRSVTNI